MGALHLNWRVLTLAVACVFTCPGNANVVINEGNVCVGSGSAALRLRCRADEYMLITEAQIGMTRRHRARFCDNIFLSNRHCTPESPNVKNGLAVCNTKSLCQMRVSLHLFDVAKELTACRKMRGYRGDVYLTVQYVCKPRLYEFYSLGDAQHVVTEKSTVHLLTPRYPQLSSYPGTRCSIKFHPKTPAEKHEFKITLVEGASVMVGGGDASGCRVQHVLLLLAEAADRPRIHSTCVSERQEGQEMVHQYLGPVSFLEYHRRHPQAKGRAWIELEVVSRAADGSDSASGTLAIQCTAIRGPVSMTPDNIPMPVVQPGKSIRHNVVQCFEPLSTTTFTCPDSHFIQLASRWHSGLKMLKSSNESFCSHPVLARDDCYNFTGHVYDFFKACQTLTTCTRHVTHDTFHVAESLRTCRETHGYAGNVYFFTAYDCVPRTFDFLYMDNARGDISQGDTFFLLSNDFPNMSYHPGYTCDLKLVQLYPNTSHAFEIDLVDGDSRYRNGSSARMCRDEYQLILVSFRNGEEVLEHSCIKQDTMYPKTIEGDTLYLHYIRSNIEAVGSVWLKIRAVTYDANNRSIAAGARISTRCTALPADEPTEEEPLGRVMDDEEEGLRDGGIPGTDTNNDMPQATANNARLVSNKDGFVPAKDNGYHAQWRSVRVVGGLAGGVGMLLAVVVMARVIIKCISKTGEEVEAEMKRSTGTLVIRSTAPNQQTPA